MEMDNANSITIDEIKSRLKRIDRLATLEEFKRQVNLRLPYTCEAKFMDVFAFTRPLDPEKHIFAAPAILFFKVICKDGGKEKSYFVKFVVKSIYVKFDNYEKIIIYEHEPFVDEYSDRQILTDLAALKAALG